MIKRIFDLAAALAVLPLMLPVFAVIAVLIKIDSPGPVFYRGLRVGLHRKPFRIFKFRTMVVDAERLGSTSTARDDARLIRIAGFLRKYKIDELPQLFNILKGEMSFVGPRPEMECLTGRYTKEDQAIFDVKPGLTDYASAKFINLGHLLGNENIDEKYITEIEPEKIRLRLKYAREHSLLIDLKIIFLTVARMLRIPFLWNTRS